MGRFVNYLILAGSANALKLEVTPGDVVRATGNALKNVPKVFKNVPKVFKRGGDVAQATVTPPAVTVPQTLEESIIQTIGFESPETTLWRNEFNQNEVTDRGWKKMFCREI